MKGLGVPNMTTEIKQVKWLQTEKQQMTHKSVFFYKKNKIHNDVRSGFVIKQLLLYRVIILDPRLLGRSFFFSITTYNPSDRVTVVCL
jgi:hypothetical protein